MAYLSMSDLVGLKCHPKSKRTVTGIIVSQPTRDVVRVKFVTSSKDLFGDYICKYVNIYIDNLIIDFVKPILDEYNDHYPATL